MLTDKLFHGTALYHQPFSKLCEPIKQYLGMSNSAYLNVNQDGSVVYIHSNYKWMEGYIQGKHYNLDPHLVHPDNLSDGFYALIINHNYTYEEYNDTVLLQDEAANKSDYGFTYVAKTAVDFTAFCFTTDKSNHKFINILLNQANIIKLFIQKLDNDLKSSFPELQHNKAQLITLKGDLFFQQHGKIFNK